MKYNIIGSSSKGNAIVVEDNLLLDCGVTYIKLKPYLKDIKLIFISHAHKDHILPPTIKKISYNYPNIKFLTGSRIVVKKLVECGVKKEHIFILPTFKWYNMGLFKVKLELLIHDTPNYGLKWEINGKKGIYLVDTASVDNIEAKGYDLYLIEANYKEEILEKHLKECSEEELVYLNRVPLTHLSYESANDFLINNMGNNSEFKYIHESNYNFEGDE